MELTIKELRLLQYIKDAGPINFDHETGHFLCLTGFALDYEDIQPLIARKLLFRGRLTELANDALARDWKRVSSRTSHTARMMRP